MNVLVYGGSASGKSEFAENLICNLHKNLEIENCNKKLVYFATLDKKSGGDTKNRIEKHRRQRIGKGFETIELDRSIFVNSELLISNYRLSILVEDLGNLVARVVFSGNSFFSVDSISLSNSISSVITNFFDKLFDRCENIVIVGNDIFLEKLDFSDDGMRIYLEVLATITKKISEKCDKVVRVVSGIALNVKS